MKLSSVFTAGITAAVCSFAPIMASGAPTYRVALDVAGYSGEDPLSNFPVPVRISESSITDFHYADCAEDGADVAFTDAQGNALSREIDVWNTNGESIVWVSVPSLADGARLFMTYGDADVTSQPESQTNGVVWSRAGYVGVWHMNSTSPADASRSGNDGTGNGNVAVVAGKVGNGLSYPDTGAFVSCGSSLAESVLIGGYTVEGWVNLANTTGNKALFGKSGFISYRLEGTAVKITTPAVTDYGNINNYITAANEWRHFALSFVPDTTDGARHYLDGALKKKQTTTGINNKTDSIEMWLGRNQWGANQGFVGLLDEYRLSASVRSADWVAASFASQSSPSFLTNGTAQAILAPELTTPVLGRVRETTAALSVEVVNLGKDASSATIYGLLSENGAAEAETSALASVTTLGTASITFTGLEPGTHYTVRLFARNEVNGVVHAGEPIEAVAFTTHPADPSPALSLSAVTIYAAGADLSVAVPRFGYQATALTSLTLHYGTSSNSLDSALAMTPPAEEGDSASCRLTRLAPGTTYYVKAVATNDLATPASSESAVFSFTTRTIEQANFAAVEATGATITALTDNTKVVKFLADGTLTIPDGARARLLLVGGGGAGGYDCSGGGGAGGMLEIASTNLAAGTYAVTVGAGGQPVDDRGVCGGKGGDTVLAKAGEAQIRLVALGGGGGAGWNVKQGADGGSGGGGCNTNGKGGTGTSGQGNDGGTTGSSKSNGGGGGAGAPGTGGTGTKAVGVGGDGRTSDITGEEVWYAGGGGGGGYDNTTSVINGGRGGGGNGARKVDIATRQATTNENCTISEYDAECGVNGLGGGGGGGNNSDHAGRPGGSGVLVARLSPLFTDLSIPSVAINSLTAGPESVSVAATIHALGFDAVSATVSYRIASSVAGLESATPVTVGTYTAAGDVDFTVRHLAAGQGLFIRLDIENDSGAVNYTGAFAFTPHGGSFAPVVTEGAVSGKAYLGDTVWTFTSNAVFTLSAPQSIRYLAVAGGGGGGRSNQAGGGGGAGGMLVGANLMLEPGTYVVTVGEGGAASTANSTRGGNGGDTWLGKVEGDTTNVVFKTIGGGGGGSYNTTEGLPGGSGGGAGLQNSSYNKAGGAGTAGQGNAGGNTSPGTYALPGGGGGAGAAGAPGTATASGAGGAGRSSDITGENIYYAGGGGGGGRNENVSSVRMGGEGGIGGGGHGRRSYSAYGDEDGVDGLGGGGGGSCGDKVGGRGGSGVLILRGPRTSADAPEAAILSLDPTPDGATVSARLEYTGIADEADVTISYTLRGSGVTNTLVSAQDAAAGASWTRTLDGLTYGDTYDFIATASNAGGEMVVIASVEVPADAMSVTDTTGAAEVRRVGTDLVAIYTNPASSGTFTVANAGFAEILLVGGGGGGGRQFGAGGGAGGFVHVESVYLTPGAYTVEVGAGGAGATHASSDNVYGGNGGDSVFAKVGEAQNRLVAFGGGGGASAGGNYRTGRNGGSGGGSIQIEVNNWNVGGHGVPGQGHDGSSGGTYISRNGYSSYEMPGGGGGAGEPGDDTDEATRTIGKGGDGLPCAITGEEVWYAGGGGAGAQNIRIHDTPNGEYIKVDGGDGGRGGGGRGHRDSDAWVGDEYGVDGLGGGGGGGRRDGSNNATSGRNGARGGSGTVIIRWKATAADTAAATISGVEGATKGAIVKGTVENGTNVTIEMATAVAGGELGAYTVLATGLNAGEAFTLALSGLADETAYDYAIRVAGGDVSGATSGTFTTLAAAVETAIAVAANAADPTAVDVMVTLASSGDLSVAYGLAPDSLTLSAAVATGATPGTYAATIRGLGAGKTWYFAPVVGGTRGETVSITLPAAGAIPAQGGEFGLWQTAMIPYDTAALRTALADDSLWDAVIMSNGVSGVLAANCAVETLPDKNWRFLDPITGQPFIWNSPKTCRLFAYRGYMYMEGGKTYTFGSRWAGSLRLSIGGSVVIDMDDVQMTDGRGTFTPSTTGWYGIDARVGRTSNTFGIDGDGVNSWTSFGLAFNTTGVDAPMPESNWTPLMDDGSGSLLRQTAPACRTIALASSEVQDGALSVTASVGAGETATAYVVYGARDPGTSGASGISGLPGVTVVSLGEIAASDAATTVGATVAGWGMSALVARLALVTDGAIAWTEPVAYAASVLPNLSGVFADAPDGDELAVSGLVSGGTAPYTARILVGASADALESVATAHVNAAGAFTATALDLKAGSTIYWQVMVTDANGARAATDIAQMALPGKSRLYNQTLDGKSYNVANPVSASQRTLTLGGTLAVLGAGDTWVGLLYGTWYPVEPAVGNSKTALHDGDLFSVTNAGGYSITRTFDWDQNVRFNWMATNTNGRLSWNDWRPNSSAYRDVAVVDAQTYTWKGGAEGEWSDVSSWQDEGIWEDNAGYPRRGSGARFLAGTTNVVFVGDSTDTHGSDHRFSQLYLEEGADVTFSTKAGASTRLELVGEGNAVPARTFGLDLRQNSTLTFSNCLAYVNNSNLPYWRNGTSDKNYLQTTGVALRIVAGSTVTLGNSNSGSAWNMNGKADSLLVMEDSSVTIRGLVNVEGARAKWVLDNARATQAYQGDGNGYISLRGSSMDDAATLVIRGAHPVLMAGSRVFNDKGDTVQYIDFAVPEGGWREAPIQTHAANATRAFGVGTGSGRTIVLRIPAVSPAVLAGQTLDVPLVNWPAGIDTTYVTLDPANLPHPATDSFYTTTEAATGNTILWAHLVGQTESADPQVVDFRQTAVSATGATITFMAIPGSGASGASVAATILDAAGENAVQGASVSPSPATIDAAGVVTATVTGLEAGTQYTLSVTLADTGDDDNAATATYSFWTLGDYGAGTSADATATATDGPFTVWTFNDTATAGQVLTVTKPGYADILVVGGGGSGGGGKWGEYGGGGGGGGQVRAETVFLLPGEHPVIVGAGGARRTNREGNGNAGLASSFDDIAAVGGGYGAYDAVGGTGASGGGGSNNKAGGGATAGFAGGKGASNGGGGGGGGAGSAGSDGASGTGGAGGAGVESAITGQRVIYGAGGGGGAGRQNSVSGKGGAPSAGDGSANLSAWHDAALVATMDAADGFGGGGGGGTASWDATLRDTTTAMCGGAGGSGTVIVRMRTATALVDEPQFALRTTAPRMDGVDAEIELFSLGDGSAEADLLIAVDETASYDASVGFTVTNLVETWSSIGWKDVSAIWLKPSTSYTAKFVVTNANGYAESAVFTFTTRDEERGESSRPVSIASTTLTADSLYATLSIDLGAEAAAVTAFWGDDYQGTDTNAWASSRALGSVPANETAFIGAIPAADVADSRYLRILAVTESGGVSWTQVVYPREMEEVSEIEPQVTLVEVTDIAGDSASVTASLLHPGTGAQGGRADVTIEFSADAGIFTPDASSVTNSQVLHAAASAGTLAPVKVTGLRPDRIYTARLKVENASRQVAYTDAFTFRTVAAGSGGTSAAGLWQQVVDLGADPTVANMTAIAFDQSKSEIVEGALMGYNAGKNSPNVTSTMSGKTYSWADKRMFIYSGYMWFEPGATYTIKSHVDDFCLVAIDGSNVHKQVSNQNAAPSTYTPVAGGWLPIDIRVANGTGGHGANNAYMGLGFNTNGYTGDLVAGTSDLTAPTVNYTRFIDQGDGSLVRTQPQRYVSVKRYETTASGVDFTIVCGQYPASGTLLAAYGATDGGSDTNAWDEVVAIGMAPAAGGTVTWSWTGDPSATPFFRFFTEDGTMLGDSGTVFIDAVNPYVAAGEFSEDGDRITVNGTVVAEGASAATVVVEWNDGEAFDASAAQSREITGWTQGEAFTEVIGATPFTNVWVRLVATNADGGYDATAPVCLATRGPAQFGPDVAPTVSHRTVTYNGMLERLGAGETKLILYTGPSADALAPVATNAVAAAGAFSFVKTYPTDPQTIYYAYLAYSETDGGSVFDSWSATNSVATRDDVTYTWKADVYEGAWNDPANWTPNAHVGDCTGYPNHTSSSASFKDCTAEHPVMVNVNGKYTVGNLKYYGSGASDITFTGTGPAESGLTAGHSYGASAIKANSSVEFRDLTLVRTTNWDIQRGVAAATNITVRFSNVVSTGSEFGMSAGFSRMEIADGSVIYLTARFNFGSTNSVLVVDDSTLNAGVQNFHFGADNGIKGRQTMIMRGANPKIVAGDFFIYNHADPVGGASIVFEVPVGGFAETPIQVSRVGDNGSSSGSAQFDFAIDPLSPALCKSRARLTGMVMVQTSTSINKAKVVEDIGTVPPNRYKPASDPVGAFRYDDPDSPMKILLSVKGWGPPPTIFLMR